ncbi:AAA family ATPase [Zavarzinella formosa]|uniref:AAA family ATPase n=1 Tax=Zavarzinella formosa TaxID=360055 RepID=UPI0002F83E16|nr:MoxR family ATPase [Zavarzinella formosa]
MSQDHRLTETITLSQAKRLITALAAEQSLLLLSPPGIGKSDIVRQAAAEAGLPCRSLLGTQIAPEDVSGIPRIVGERSVFCPPRILLPEDSGPFCLFLDELPACAPDVQKAFYSLLLERRLGEFPLPPGTWVVAAGNRAEDRALVRTISSALVNRVFVLEVKVDFKEWMTWAKSQGVRSDILAFLTFMPSALQRNVPREPVPFSTPRAWATLSRALDLADRHGITDSASRRALAFGRVSGEDAAIFAATTEARLEQLHGADVYVRNPDEICGESSARWLIIHAIRLAVRDDLLGELTPDEVNHFLRTIPQEFCFAVLTDLVHKWGALGADPAMFDLLREVTGL